MINPAQREKMKVLGMLLLVMLGLVHGEGVPTGSAFLVAHKEMDVSALAEGIDEEVTIRVINIGDVDAVEVVVKDDWPLEYFDLLEGSMSADFGTIAAGEEKEMKFTMVPLSSGRFLGFPAKVTYKDSSSGTMMSVDSSYIQDYINIYPKELHRKFTSMFENERFAFSTGVLLALFVPIFFQIHYVRSYNMGLSQNIKMKTQ